MWKGYRTDGVCGRGIELRGVWKGYRTDRVCGRVIELTGCVEEL